ncbi:acyltransferase family protein, partial [Streptomyces sp. URMC 124]|uniref:acyltransferase family protein n=1 Tax=Streptomyces sp. URMC 124 TaxID=3423405 RepID=UPI003F1DA904
RGGGLPYPHVGLHGHRRSAPTGCRSRLPSLTGMRFIAALLVFLYHASLPHVATDLFADGGAAEAYRQVLSRAGWVGVSFFFVLSGFVMTWSARPGDRAVSFWRRRFFKIFPNHAVMWVLGLLLIAASTTGAAQAVPNLLLVQSWFHDIDVYFSVNPPSWSLSCELLFYLTFPFWVRLVRRIRADRLWWYALGTMAAVAAVALAADLFVPGSPVIEVPYAVSEPQFWLVYILPATRLLDFVLGILMARIVLEGRWITLGLLPAGLLTVAAYGVSLLVPPPYAINAVTIVPFALLIPAAATADVNGTRSPFRGRVMLWLGEVSFAFYMVQQVLLEFARGRMGARWALPTPLALAVIALEAGAALLCAWLLHTAVERPAMRFARPRKRT